jgi:hypothetical protein
MAPSNDAALCATLAVRMAVSDHNKVDAEPVHTDQPA